MCHSNFSILLAGWRSCIFYFFTWFLFLSRTFHLSHNFIYKGPATLWRTPYSDHSVRPCVRSKSCPPQIFHIPVGLWSLACRCITMRWCVAYQYCFCMTFDLRLNYWLWRSTCIFVSAPEFYFSHMFMTFGIVCAFPEDDVPHTNK